jgi:hypothetical protein
MMMETTPYSLQSPEAIAKDYGGNKQQIAQAAQMGLVDPTAAVLAGMFIDRMRGAQALEQAPQQTVAQQVLSPQPQQMPQQGLGGTPEAAMLQQAMPAPGAPPPIAAPQQMPQQMPMMANGGLVGLPIPDNMYDYAGGGIVAFQQGGTVEEQRKREMLTRQARTQFAGMPGAPDLNTLSVAELEALVGGGGEQTAVDPLAPTAAESARMGVPAPAGMTVDPLAPTAAESARIAAPTIGGMADIGAALAPQVEEPIEEPAAIGGGGVGLGGIGSGLRGHYDQVLSILDSMEEGEGIKAYRKSLEEADTEIAKQKKQDAWAALAEFGFRWAGSESPYALQAAGQAGTATMPSIQASMKEARSAAKEALKGRADLDMLKRNEQTKALELGATLYSKEQDRAATLAAASSGSRDTDLERYARGHLASMRAKGDERSDAELLQEGRELKIATTAGIRAETQTAEMGRKIGADALEAARKDAMSDPAFSKRYRSAKSEEEKEALLRERAQFYQGVLTPQTDMGGAPAPAQVPTATQGAFTVRAPDGKVYSFPTQEAANQARILMEQQRGAR